MNFSATNYLSDTRIKEIIEKEPVKSREKTILQASSQLMVHRSSLDNRHKMKIDSYAKIRAKDKIHGFQEETRDAKEK